MAGYGVEVWKIIGFRPQKQNL